MSRPGAPQMVRLGGPPATAPQSQQPQAKITMLEADQILCNELLNVGFPQNIVIEIAQALAEKITLVLEANDRKRANTDLLTANQRLLERAETAESALKAARKTIQELRQSAEVGSVQG